MNWTDQAILLTVAKAAKRTLILEVLTENYGRCRAISTLEGQEAPVLLPGSFLNINCTSEDFGKPLKAKLLEIDGGIMAADADDVGLLALSTVKDYLVSLLESEDPVPEIYDAAYGLMTSLVNEDGRWPLHFAALEFTLLSELGHLAGISQCMSAFRHGDAIYMHPATGRAVPREQAGAFLDKLIPLPGFLLGQTNGSLVEVRLGLELTQRLMAEIALPKAGIAAQPETRVPLMNHFKRLRDIPRVASTKKKPSIDDESRRRRMMSSKPLLVSGGGSIAL